MELKIRNAIIKSTRLGVESHGIMTYFLNLEYNESICQSFTGYALDNWNEKLNRRVGTAYGMELIMRILEVAGADSWEDLVGKHLRVECNHMQITKIGHVLEDIWLNPQEDLDDFIVSNPKSSGKHKGGK